jgi:glycosyltransferase involved in cell wall biosynthesis
MVDLPKITIVTPSYNQAEFIEETIRSVLDQDYPNLEYIIMDGGSTDGSVEIIKRYENRLAHWESHSDDGQADAVHRGFERSTGEILGYLNSDDLLLPGSLENVGRFFFANPKEEWVAGGTLPIGPNCEYSYDRIGNPNCIPGSRVSFRQLLFWGMSSCQPASFWRRDTFFAAGGFNRSLQFCFDYDMFFRLSQRRRSGRIEEILACFRQHPNSKTNTISNIMDDENEILWRKYGRYKKSKSYRKIAAFWYNRRNPILFKILQIKMFLGLLRRPTLLNRLSTPRKPG